MNGSTLKCSNSWIYILYIAFIIYIEKNYWIFLLDFIAYNIMIFYTHTHTHTHTHTQYNICIKYKIYDFENIFLHNKISVI